jgi:tripartite-type tricarboxylate transporter receptor subunit TctC
LPPPPNSSMPSPLSSYNVPNTPSGHNRPTVLQEGPTVGEFLPGYEASGWVGFGVPKDTPAAIIDILNSEVNAGLADPMIKARFGDLGAAVLPSSPADFGKLIASDTEKWAKVIR